MLKGLAASSRPYSTPNSEATGIDSTFPPTVALCPVRKAPEMLVEACDLAGVPLHSKICQASPSTYRVKGLSEVQHAKESCLLVDVLRMLTMQAQAEDDQSSFCLGLSS